MQFEVVFFSSEFDPKVYAFMGLTHDFKNNLLMRRNSYLKPKYALYLNSQ